MRLLCVTTLLFNVTSLSGQPTIDPSLKEILTKNKDTTFQHVLNDPETYRLQIIYTQINRTRHNKPVFKNYYYRFDPGLYFNPASTVKLPLALLALEKLNRMNARGVTKSSAMQFDSNYEKQVPLYKDSTSQNGL